MSWQRATQKCFNKINHDTYISYMWVTTYIYILSWWAGYPSAQQGFFSVFIIVHPPIARLRQELGIAVLVNLIGIVFAIVTSDPTRSQGSPSSQENPNSSNSSNSWQQESWGRSTSSWKKEPPWSGTPRTHQPSPVHSVHKTNARPSQNKSTVQPLGIASWWPARWVTAVPTKRARPMGQSSAPPFLWSSPDWTACPRRSSPSPHRLVLLTYDSIISLATFTASLFPIGYSSYSYPFWIGRSYPFAGIRQYVNIEQKHTKTFIAQTVPDCPHIKKMPSLLIPALMVPRESQPCRVCGGWVEPQLQPQTPPTSV